MGAGEAPRGEWWDRWLKARDVLLFFAGMAGTAYETIHGPPQMDLLILFGGMVGVPIFLPGGFKLEVSHRSKDVQTEAKVDVSPHGFGHEERDG